MKLSASHINYKVKEVAQCIILKKIKDLAKFCVIRGEPKF